MLIVQQSPNSRIISTAKLFFRQTSSPRKPACLCCSYRHDSLSTAHATTLLNARRVASHTPSSCQRHLNEREGVIQEGVAFRRCRAIRVVWISFRPSEPETWVRILHCPPNFFQFRREAQVPAPCP